MRLLQFTDAGRTRVARVENNGAVLPLARVESTWQLAMKAANERRPLEQVAAAEAVEKWRFRPGTLNGQPVDVIFNLTVNFKLN